MCSILKSKFWILLLCSFKLVCSVKTKQNLVNSTWMSTFLPSSPCFSSSNRKFSILKADQVHNYKYCTSFQGNFRHAKLGHYIYSDSRSDAVYFKYAYAVWSIIRTRRRAGYENYVDFMNLALDALESIDETCAPSTFVHRDRFNSLAEKSNAMFFFLLTLINHALKVQQYYQLKHLTGLIETAIDFVRYHTILDPVINDIVCILNTSYDFTIEYSGRKTKISFPLGYETVFLIYTERESVMALPIFNILWSAIKQSTDATVIKYLSKKMEF